MWRKQHTEWVSGRRARCELRDSSASLANLPFAAAALYVLPSLALSPLVAAECVVTGGCGGDVPGAGSCGIGTAPVETGSGCGFVNNCQEIETMSGPAVEILPSSFTDPAGLPLFDVQLYVEVETPWNVWARTENPNGQLQARWQEGSDLSLCHSTSSDQSRLWVSAGFLSCSQIWDLRLPENGQPENPNVRTLDLVASVCGPPCKEGEPGCFFATCRETLELDGLTLGIPVDEIVKHCPPVRPCPLDEAVCGPQACPRGAGGRGSRRFGGIGERPTRSLR